MGKAQRMFRQENLEVLRDRTSGRSTDEEKIINSLTRHILLAREAAGVSSDEGLVSGITDRLHEACHLMETLAEIRDLLMEVDFNNEDDDEDDDIDLDDDE